MIEKNKCGKCKHVYEISWDDDTDDYFNYDDADTSDQFSDDDDDELYPEYCPFCGVHHEYGGEYDSSDESLDY